MAATCKNVSYSVDFKLNPGCCGKECDKWGKNMLDFLSTKKEIHELRNQVLCWTAVFF